MKGRIDSYMRGVLGGWVWNPDKPNEAAKFELLVNGTPMGNFKADRYRGDLQRNGIGDGRHSFIIRLELTEDQQFTFDIRDPETGDIVAPTFQTYNQTSTQATIQIEFKDLPKVKRLTNNSSGEHDILIAEADFRRLLKYFELNGPIDEARYLANHKDVEGAIKRGEFIDSRDHFFPSGYIEGREATSTTIAPDKVSDFFYDFCRTHAHEIVTPYLHRAFKNENWTDVIAYTNILDQLSELGVKELTTGGRANLYANKIENSIFYLTRAVEKAPTDEDSLFYLGLAYGKAQRFLESWKVLTRCTMLSPENGKFALEAGKAAASAAAGGQGVSEAAPDAAEEAIALLQRAAKLEPKNFRPLAEMSKIYLQLQHLDHSMEKLDAALLLAPKEFGLWQDKSRLAMRLGQIPVALDSIQKARQLRPDNDSAKFSERIIQRLIPSQVAETDLFVVAPLFVTNIVSNVSVVSKDEDEAITTAHQPYYTLAPRFSSEINANAWSIISPDCLLSDQELQQAKKLAFPWSGAIQIVNDTRSVLLVRDELIASLYRAEIIAERCDPGFLEALIDRVAAAADWAQDFTVAAHTRLHGSGRVLLLSRYGVDRFGGAEHFMAMCAAMYQRQGYEVILCGTNPSSYGRRGLLANDIRFDFIIESPEELLRYVIEENISLVHVVAGLGLEVISCLHYLKVLVVFGTHFWREVFLPPTYASGYFPDIDRKGKLRPEFDLILESAAAIYTNSRFTRQIIEQKTGFRTPIVYSLPDDKGDVEFARTQLVERRLVLLSNARSDKGFDLVCQIALRCPTLNFVAIVTQSQPQAPRALIDKQNLKNVTLIDRTEDMASLYEQAIAVLVPSYKFVETFSRVTIEAQRHGVPVIGSDRGNVPILLEDSGVSLPEDPELWSQELERLSIDRDYWEFRSQKALRNSEKYAASLQERQLASLVSDLGSTFLVGVGTGMGNILQATPLIRHLAQTLKHRVDVVVAGDYDDVLCLVHNDEFVRHSFLLSPIVLRRKYNGVFLSNSFGPVLPEFASPQVFRSRDLMDFNPSSHHHEAEFNLASAQKLMNIPYSPDDVLGHYVGNWEWEPDTAKPFIGIHAGSKKGRWASKRWPYFEELAARLIDQGFRVASFGTADEFVPGTVNCTGGTIEEMISLVTGVTYFIANDSGVMNIAAALGVPMTVIFGPTEPRTRGPLKSNVQMIVLDKECAPCEWKPQSRSIFSSGTCSCLAELSEKEVRGKVLSHIMAYLQVDVE